MTYQEARLYVTEHKETDGADPRELEQVFTALAGRPPNTEERNSLWWHISELVQD